MEETIENTEKKVIDIDLILKAFKNKSDRKSIKEIKSSISEMTLANEDIFASTAIDEISAQRRLVEKAQEQIDRLITLLENK